MNLGRIDERTSKYEANGASMLGDAGFSQKVRKLGGNCFLSPRLTQLFVTFAPLKRVSRKLSSLLIQNWRAREQLKCVIVRLILNFNRGNSTSTPVDPLA